MIRIRISITAALVLISSGIAEAACGDRGGPGFRKPDGKCASWDEIGRGVCGRPPSRFCSEERVIAVPPNPKSAVPLPPPLGK
jgi:hypothetical protein